MCMCLKVKYRSDPIYYYLKETPHHSAIVYENRLQIRSVNQLLIINLNQGKECILEIFEKVGYH